MSFNIYSGSVFHARFGLPVFRLVLTMTSFALHVLSYTLCNVFLSSGIVHKDMLVTNSNHYISEQANLAEGSDNVKTSPKPVIRMFNSILFLNVLFTL